MLAVLPATRSRKPTGEPNLLFFGSFTQMGEEEFIDELIGAARAATTASTGRWRATSTRTAWCSQRKKYRLLGYAYRIFLVGLVASCVAYRRSIYVL